MIKKHLKTIIITSVLTLAPMIVGLILWDKLPESMPIHFDVNNQPDDFAGKGFAVFGIPLLLLAFHLITIFATSLDPKNESVSDKILNLIFYIIPGVSLLVCGMIYPASLGKEMRMILFVNLFIGLVFVIIGNYMPKCKPSYTIGIKIPWTLNDDENWVKTHQFAGKLWVVCGLAIIATAFAENMFIFSGISAVMVFVPMVYSYAFYKKKKDKAE